MRTRPGPKADVARAVLRDLEAQRDGMKKLRAWYNDWSTTLRNRFNRREQLQAGLLHLHMDTTPEEPAGEDKGADKGKTPADKASN